MKRPSRRTAVALAVVAAVLVLYVAGSLLAPRRIPRLAVLPKPADRVWFDTCRGEPHNRHTETWERSGPFWTSTRFTTLKGCL